MQKNKKAFTLIEMLVVIGIIGLLSSMILVSVSSIRKNSVCTRREANVENVRGAVNMYYSIKTEWPDIAGGWKGLITTLSTAGYLTDSIAVDSQGQITDDEDGEEPADYKVQACAGVPGCQMQICNTCSVSGREGYTGDTRCLNVK